MILTHGSLFSGIGGFDLAAEWMGWENVFHCEKNEFGRKILNYYWPQSISYDDIKEADFTKHTGEIDILTGGFPCQPYSNAGKRKGKEDDRHLWPYMLKAIEVIKPKWIVGENVRGLVNWNRGLVFHEVQAELENQGYQVQPFLLPACAVGAPHRRDRIWFVSRLVTDTNGQRFKWYQELEKRCDSQSIWLSLNEFDAFSSSRIIADTNGQRLERGTVGHQSERRKESFNKQSKGLHFLPNKRWEEFPTQPPVYSRNDGFSTEMDGITLPKWREESVKAYGNAVVPQLVLPLFKTIEKMETIIQSLKS